LRLSDRLSVAKLRSYLRETSFLYAVLFNEVTIEREFDSVEKVAEDFLDQYYLREEVVEPAIVPAETPLDLEVVDPVAVELEPVWQTGDCVTTTENTLLGLEVVDSERDVVWQTTDCTDTTDQSVYLSSPRGPSITCEQEVYDQISSRRTGGLVPSDNPFRQTETYVSSVDSLTIRETQVLITRRVDARVAAMGDQLQRHSLPVALGNCALLYLESLIDASRLLELQMRSVVEGADAPLIQRETAEDFVKLKTL
jgi:hypothetical protein